MDDIIRPPKAQAIMDDYPAWAVWIGINSIWYARLLNSTPPVILREGTAEELRDALGARVKQAEEYWKSIGK
jgi:hypothetical protein